MFFKITRLGKKVNFTFLFITFMFVYVCYHKCLLVHLHVTRLACGDQTTTCRNLLSWSTILGLGIKLRMPGVVASPFTC